ncbi:hypothetical protein Nepgr_000395 [Nepenthes gracilis]|uniref:Glutaredoxin domain-containing protein n=1 Tax=Nepenthes gracilis TaxID=150966 RepID=A0AAD3P306_NEPGR|nr:hypothetical protein Nepgr_000395 [Nepenthes gracilis]
MYQALPYKISQPATTKSPLPPPFNSHRTQGAAAAAGKLLKGREDMKSIVSENAVIVFGRRGCCMSHVVKRLLLGLGVNPAVYEVDEPDEKAIVDELEMIGGGSGDGEEGRVQFPAVFIGGKLFGGLDQIMAAHITGKLIPILREAGALWL